MQVNMTAARRSDPELIERLERLGGDDPSCCVPVYEGRAKSIAASEEFGRALRRAKAIADDRRLLALALLKREKELCACEIQAATGLTHATVSHHMSVLATAGLVKSRRERKWTYYRLVDRAEAIIP